MASLGESLSKHRKLSLIIDNRKYHRSENTLTHSVETIEELGDLLTKVGFHVTRASNLKKFDMTSEIIRFSKTIEDGDFVLFYFSGHGYHVNGVNYLLPINDSWIKTHRDVQDFGISFDRIVKRFSEKSSSYANIFILDCCKPYLSNDLSTSVFNMENKGLCAVDPTDGAFIQFACAENEVVSDDLFTKQLLKNITKESVNIVDVFQRIVNDVYEASNQTQRPLSINGLKEYQDIFLNYVAPSIIPVWDEVRMDEKESILQEQAALNICYNPLPDLEEITDPDNEKYSKS